MKYSQLILSLLFISLGGSLSARPCEQTLGDTVQHRTIHLVGLEIHPTYVVPTHRFIKGKNHTGEPVRAALSGHVKYAFQFAEGTRFNRLYPFAYQGIGVGFNDFLGTSHLGSPVAIYAYQGSQIARINPHLTFNYEWNFGVSFGWKEYNYDTYRKNHVIGTDLNAYMNLAFLLNWQLSAHYHFTTGVSMTHCSNGNTHYPNQGLNLLEGKIGIVRTFGDEEDMKSMASLKGPSLLLPRRVSYDLVIYGGFRVREIKYDGKKYIPKKNFPVIGVNFNPMYHFNNYLRAGASLDLQYDESSNLINHVDGVGKNGIEYHSQPFHERLSAGFSLRGEWAMPIFAINAGIGYNFYAKSFDTQKFYQVLAMKIFLNEKAFIHIGYQMNQFKDPNNLMLGLGYRFH